MLHYYSNEKEVKLSPKTVIGLMSGTSLDGIDAVLVRIFPKYSSLCDRMDLPSLNIETLCGLVFPFPDKFQKKLSSIIENKQGSLEDICKLNFQMGELLARSVIELLRSFGVNNTEVDLIGSHGQTIYHISNNEVEDTLPERSTLQIGEPSIIAQKTGITTIADFRPRDIAAGGEGAPLVCFADMLLFADSDTTRLIQNIGGIANVTVIPNNAPPFAFDTGPGNTMIDLVAKNYFGQKYDNDGKLAFSGAIDEKWIDKVIEEEPYYKLDPPKSTGRELFNLKYLNNILDKYPIENSRDLIANVSALTAKTIVHSYQKFVFPHHQPSTIILGGGGAYNPFLLENIKRYLNNSIEIKTHEDFGISNKFKEAIAFALLAYTTYYGIPNNVPSCTGAMDNVIMGKIIPPNLAFN